jgi:hypothetical protein
MSALHVGAAHAAIHRVRVELAVVGFFQDERPLQAAAGQVDWRLCGTLSHLIRAGRLDGKAGDAVLIPAGGGLFASQVMALGLGARHAFDLSAARSAIVDALARATALRVRSVALPFPFAGRGDRDLGLDALLDGASEARRAGGDGFAPAVLALVSAPGARPELIRALRAREATAPPGLRIRLPEERRSAPAGNRALGAGA